jgi:hypothetical protein
MPGEMCLLLFGRLRWIGAVKSNDQAQWTPPLTIVNEPRFPAFHCSAWLGDLLSIRRREMPTYQGHEMVGNTPMGDAYDEYQEQMSMVDTCEECVQSLGCKIPCDVREQLRHHIKCAEITLKGYRDYLHDMRIVITDGKMYRGVPGEGFGGKWEFYHESTSTWCGVQNYQIKSDLNKISGSTREYKETE